MNPLLESLLTPPSGSYPLDIVRITTSLGCSFAISFTIAWVYPKLHQGDVLDGRLGRVMMLTCMVTTLIIMPISTNITLSLGMVGALSIVRFRTAIKEPLDIAFMFWAIAVGVASGAGFYLVCIAGSLVIGVLLLLSKPFSVGQRKGCIMVLRYLPNIDKTIFQKLPKHKLHAKFLRPDLIDLTIELSDVSQGIQIADELVGIAGVEDISVVDAAGDFFQAEDR